MKITKEQLKEIIKEEASRLQKKTVLENRKKVIIRELRMLNEDASELLVYKMENGKKTNDIVGTHQYGKGFIPNELGKKLGLEPHPTSIPNQTIIDRENSEGLDELFGIGKAKKAAEQARKDFEKKLDDFISKEKGLVNKDALIQKAEGDNYEGKLIAQVGRLGKFQGKKIINYHCKNDNCRSEASKSKFEKFSNKLQQGAMAANQINEEETDVAVNKVKEAFSNSDEGYLKKSLEQRNPGKDSAGSTFLETLSIDDLINADWEPYNHPNISSPAIGFKSSIPGKLGVAEMKSLPKDLKVKFQPAHKGEGEGAEAVAEIPESNLLVKHTTLILGPKDDGLTVWTFFPGDATPKFDPISFDEVRSVVGGEGDVLYGTVEDAIKLGFNTAKNASLSLSESIRKIVRESFEDTPIKTVYKMENGKNTYDIVGSHQEGRGFVPNKLGDKLGFKSHPTSIPNYTTMGDNDSDYLEAQEIDEESKGLWANIHAKRKRGEAPAKKGDKDYPDKKSWDKASKSESISKKEYDGGLEEVFGMDKVKSKLKKFSDKLQQGAESISDKIEKGAEAISDKIEKGAKTIDKGLNESDDNSEHTSDNGIKLSMAKSGDNFEMFFPQIKDSTKNIINLGSDDKVANYIFDLAKKMSDSEEDIRVDMLLNKVHSEVIKKADKLVESITLDEN